MDKQTEEEIERLVSNREEFNKFVYTPLEVAIEELKNRRMDQSLQSSIEEKVIEEMPQIIRDKNCAVTFRQLATPNYELRRFINLVDGMEDFTPVFFEYSKDKFTDNNEWKYHLAKLFFYNGKGKKGGEKTTQTNIIDFNSSRGKKIGDISTLWGQSLVDFHHELFNIAYEGKGKEIIFLDASDWFAKSGGNARDYYENFLTIFVSNGILFENFMLDKKEYTFTKEIILPAFIRVMKKCGKKPLIVALEPTEIESDRFWMCHPAETKSLVEQRLNTV
jgi:hypothetical protein